MPQPILDPQTPLRTVLLVGDYGSGKTEVAVNLALHLAQTIPERQLTIADLDLVNPYFRCREAREPLQQAGIRVVVPGGGHEHADLPILQPEVKGLLQAPDTLAVLDVGGDQVGSRVLASLAPYADRDRLAFWFVQNANRPFNDTVEGCLATIARIEGASQLRVSGIVANTHLMDETTPQMVSEGVALAEAVAAARGIPVAVVAAMARVLEALGDDPFPYPTLIMRRIMVPPWLRREQPRLGPALFKLGPG